MIDWCCWLGHNWKTTFHNGFMISVEEKCTWCGKYRHHFLEDANMPVGEPDWRNGKHPNRPDESDGYLDL